MLTFIILIFLTVGLPVINGHACACCFPNLPNQCQTLAIDLPSCDDCTSFFCANHVKGCQRSPPCTAECKSDTSSTSTIPIPSSSTSTKPIVSSTFNDGTTIQLELFMIFVSLTLLFISI